MEQNKRNFHQAYMAEVGQTMTVIIIKGTRARGYKFPNGNNANR